MAGMVNVNSEVTDSFYRYKMPRIMAKVEGKGNGIKTVIVNMVDIAKALSRPPAYPCKYFGCELGAQTQIDAKKERYIVNGAHEATKLQELLDGFIKRFVLCPECDNPETVLIPHSKKKIIAQKCMACGYSNPSVDMTHKVCTYIMNHPPEGADSASKAYDKANKKNKTADGGDESPTDAIEDQFDAAMNNGSRNGHNNNNEGEDEDDDAGWSIDTSEAAVARRQQELSNGVKGLAITVELEKTPHERQELFYNFVMEKKKLSKLSDGSVALEVYSKAKELELLDQAPLILVGVALTENVIAEIPLYKNLFVKFLYVKDNTQREGIRANDKGQKQLLGGLEKLIEQHPPLLEKVQKILYTVYDNDLVAEEIVIEWSKKATKKFVPRELSKKIREKAASFIEWLENAEEDSEEEDEDEDDGTVTFGTATVTRPVPAVQKPAEDDDLDIDDI